MLLNTVCFIRHCQTLIQLLLKCGMQPVIIVTSASKTLNNKAINQGRDQFQNNTPQGPRLEIGGAGSHLQPGGLFTEGKYSISVISPLSPRCDATYKNVQRHFTWGRTIRHNWSATSSAFAIGF